MNMTEICEHDRKLTTMNIHLMNLTKILNKYCHNDKYVWLNMTENPKYNIRSSSIVYFHRCGIIFKISTFGQIQSFSVEFNKLTFFVVIFRSCLNRYGLLVSVISKPFFGHIDSVKLTSLYKKLNFTINCFLLFGNETLSNYICIAVP